MRVINRLPPLAHESLESLLARLGAANHYPKESWYLPLPRPSAPREVNRLRQPAHLQAIGDLVGLDTRDVRELTLGRFDSCFMNAAQPPSGEVGEGTAEVADGMRRTRFGWYAQGQGRGKVCRECLRETKGLMLPWSLRLVTACPVHLVLLSERGREDLFTHTARSIKDDPSGRALTTLVWSAIGCGEPFPPEGLGPETMDLPRVMGPQGLLSFLWRMGGLLLCHDRENPAVAAVTPSSRDIRSLGAGETHTLLSVVAGLLLDWPLSWHQTLDRIAEGELAHNRADAGFPLALASSFRGSEWRWLHRSWDDFVEERARNKPSPSVYAWLHRYYVPRSEEVPSLELRAPAPPGSDRARLRARLLEAPNYRPLPEPPWQMEEVPSHEKEGLTPRTMLSLREVARYLGTTSAHVASLTAAGILSTGSGFSRNIGDTWSFRAGALTGFLASLPVWPIPERGIEHAVNLEQVMAMLSEVGVSLAQVVVATKSGRLQQGRLTAFCAYPSPTLDTLWFSHWQVCEYLWYRREPFEQNRLVAADRLAERYGMETLQLWYAAGLLAPCRDRTDARRIRWWYDDWEVGHRSSEGQLPERLGPGVELNNAYIWKPDDVLEWRDRWYDSSQAVRHMEWYGVRGANEGRLAGWVREGRLSCRIEPGVEAGTEVRWYPRREVEELQRQLYIERYHSGRAQQSQVGKG